jgi:hypothetical protein
MWVNGESLVYGTVLLIAQIVPNMLIATGLKNKPIVKTTGILLKPTAL